MSTLTTERTHLLTWAQLEKRIGHYATMMYLIDHTPAGQGYLLYDFDRQKDSQFVEVDFIYQSEEKTVDDIWRDGEEERQYAEEQHLGD